LLVQTKICGLFQKEIGVALWCFVCGFLTKTHNEQKQATKKKPLFFHFGGQKCRNDFSPNSPESGLVALYICFFLVYLFQKIVLFRTFFLVLLLFQQSTEDSKLNTMRTPCVSNRRQTGINEVAISNCVVFVVFVKL